MEVTRAVQEGLDDGKWAEPLILEGGLSKGAHRLGLDEIPREWKRLRRESRFMEG